MSSLARYFFFTDILTFFSSNNGKNDINERIIINILKRIIKIMVRISNLIIIIIVKLTVTAKVMNL